jgi:hypothetical protein
MIDILDRAFSRIGARVRFGVPVCRWTDPFLSVQRDDDGEFYLLNLNRARQGLYSVREARRRYRALILTEHGDSVFERLCRHDGKHWRIDEVTSNQDIESALRPPKEPRRVPVAPPAPTIQFLPRPGFVPTGEVIVRNEPPLDRCGKAGFVAQQESRVVGDPVHVGRDYPNGLSESARLDLRERDPRGHRRQGWRRVQPAPTIHVRGWLWRPGEPLVVLRMWHEVRRA